MRWVREQLDQPPVRQHAVGRVGLPEDLAAAYLFLMQQPFATGQTLIVDGGGVLV